MKHLFISCIILLFSQAVLADTFYGHFPYEEAPRDKLTKFQGIWMHEDVLPDLKKMLRDARNQDIDLIIRSGFRSKKRQHYLFYGIAKKKEEQSLEEHHTAGIKVSAQLTGYSEHHTGRALDFDDGKNPTLAKSTL